MHTNEQKQAAETLQKKDNSSSKQHEKEIGGSFADDRPAAFAQRKMQETATASHLAKSQIQLQAMADHRGAQQAPVQRYEAKSKADKAKNSALRARFINANNPDDADHYGDQFDQLAETLETLAAMEAHVSVLEAKKKAVKAAVAASAPKPAAAAAAAASPASKASAAASGEEEASGSDNDMEAMAPKPAAKPRAKREILFAVGASSYVAPPAEKTPMRSFPRN